MAVEVIQKVLTVKPDRITATERLILVVMANYLRRRADGGYTDAYVSVSTIHRNSSLGRRVIQKGLKRLRDKEFIAARGVKARGAVHYMINIDRLDRERGAQSWDADRERGSQSLDPSTATTPNDVRITANLVHPNR